MSTRLPSPADERVLDRVPCTGYPLDYDRDRYEAYDEAEQDREEAYHLATTSHATGEANIAPGIHVVRTSGNETCPGCGGPVNTDEACRRCTGWTGPDRFDDADYDEYDALLDGKPRW